PGCSRSLQNSCEAGAVAVANAFAWNIGISETDPEPDRTYLGVPAERCLSQSDSNRSDTLARVYHAAIFAGMGHVGRSVADRTNRPCGLICGNVVCAGTRARPRGFFGSHATGAVGGCPAILRSLADCALDRVVDQPGNRATDPGTQRRTIDTAPPHRA